MTPTTIRHSIETLTGERGIRFMAETAEQCAEFCRLEAILITAIKLAAEKGATEADITDISLVWNDRCEVASICLGQDADGMGRFILNFAL